MAFNTGSWSVKENTDMAKLKLVIPNFSDVVNNTTKGKSIKSKSVDVGRSKFALKIYPKGHQQAKKRDISVFLYNIGTNDVVVDYTISVEGGISTSLENEKIEKNKGVGLLNFMKASEVGTDLKITVVIKLKWEDISEGELDENQVKGSDLVQFEKRVGGKLEELGEKLEQMKTFVRAEIAKVKAPPIPECPVCFLQLQPPKKIVQCLKGHKICEPCSEEETVLSCPTCKTAFMGRDFGMEAFIRELSGEN